ncbi:MAG: tRNA N6-adenosine threonylcarbamoyltransferase [Elusimicrobia bacterium]|nr:tRNA N6-adenosine threonylcarbamoyltransferase [Elusimicrobiota bacterium]
MKILGIETSCDETAAAVVKNGREILSSLVATQIPLHQPYRGVVPELASRAHLITIHRVIEAALKKSGSNSKLSGIDAIAVTVGPGLVGSLLVGRMVAETLGWIHKIPVLGVNHIEGHLLSPLMGNPQLKPPFLGLVVSGGHTELIFSQQWGRYALLGRTRDDAAGEAFDKVAKMMNLGYPGGPLIDRLARQGNPESERFPRPWLPKTWDFSFSGLKTAVLYRLREKKRWNLSQKQNLCAGFQEAVVDVLVTKTLAAARSLRVNHIVVGGGVAANSRLRKLFSERVQGANIQVCFASSELCTDNAAMIASAAFFKKKYGRQSDSVGLAIQPQLHIPFESQKIPTFQI